MNKHLILTTPALLATLALLPGCGALEPKIPQAKPQTPTSFGVTQGPSVASASETRLPGWRQAVANPQLRDLIALSLDNNRDLRISTLNVEKARALYRIQRADRLPTVNAQGGITRSGGERAQKVEDYRVELGVAAYELDLWGRVKSQSDSALHSYFATEEARRGAELSLVAEVSDAYLALSADMERKRIADDTAASYAESLRIVRRKSEIGTVSPLDVSQAEAQYASARNDAALFDAQVKQDLNALTLLVGAPVPESSLPKGDIAVMHGFAPVPVGLSSKVLLNRPDIRQAEEELRSASANVGAARAAFFPTISLTGALGYATDDLSSLWNGDRKVWSFAPTASVPIFDTGRLLANNRSAVTSRDMALATYERAIQSGFREVADALARNASLDARRKAMQDMVAASTESLRIAQARYDAGKTDYLNLLDAQRSLYAAKLSLIEVVLDEQTNRVTLYRTLGGEYVEDKKS
jgi:multidrug efflux system outer membrane protein